MGRKGKSGMIEEENEKDGKREQGAANGKGKKKDGVRTKGKGRAQKHERRGQRTALGMRR